MILPSFSRHTTEEATQIIRDGHCEGLTGAISYEPLPHHIEITCKDGVLYAETSRRLYLIFQSRCLKTNLDEGHIAEVDIKATLKRGNYCYLTNGRVIKYRHPRPDIIGRVMYEIIRKNNHK